MSTLVVIVHITVAIFLILIVLLQAGKGASIGATFGGSSQTVFGSRGPASFLGKVTTGAAALFMITSLVLSMFSARSVTVVDEIEQPIQRQEQEAPAGEEGFDPFKAAIENEIEGNQEKSDEVK